MSTNCTKILDFGFFGLASDFELNDPEDTGKVEILIDWFIDLHQKGQHSVELINKFNITWYHVPKEEKDFPEVCTL